MTKDDKLLRETILAELRRRRGLAGDTPQRTCGDPGDDRRGRMTKAADRPAGTGRIGPHEHQPAPSAGSTSE